MNLNNKINHLVRKFIYEPFDSTAFVRECNNAIDEYRDWSIYNRRDNTKIVRMFAVSNNKDKVIVRYENGSSGTMLIRNVPRNLRAHQIDLWDNIDEDQEQDFLLERMGFKG